MTAHDLAADWSWMQAAVGFRIGRSKLVWEEAFYNNTRLVKVTRLKAHPTGRLQQMVKYVSPDVEVTLVTKEEFHAL